MQQELFPPEKSKNKGKDLKAFMQANFDFSTFKKCGLYPKDLKFNDYEGQAKRICNRLGLENIYDYGKYEIRCHISYVEPGDISGMETASTLKVNEEGVLKSRPFVEVFFPNQMHI